MRGIFLFISLVIIVLAESNREERNHEETTTDGHTRRRQTRRLEERNKALVLKFYQKVFGDKDFSAIDKYIGDPYIQHNPMIEDGKEGLRKAVTEWLKDEPKQKLDIRRVGADGDLVWIHLKFHLFGKDNAIIDAFRVAKGKIVEHWDVIQVVPETSKNNNTMF